MWTTIENKVARGERLTAEEGLYLYAEAPIGVLGRLANSVREKRHGNLTTYILNMHLNYSNVCTLSCMFCAFAKKHGEEGAYEMSMEEMVSRVAPLKDIPGAEVHIVGGLHPDYPYAYYPKLLSTLLEHYPGLHLKAFTAVEIEYFAQLAGQSVDWVLEDLKAHGLQSMPGGGAEVLTERIHQKLYRDKMGPDMWLEIHQKAHNLGIRTSATMLAGHIETDQERVTHLVRLRELQDRTGGFLAYIPLRFHPENTPLKKLRFMDSEGVLRQVAVGRLMLDNFVNIKAYWVMSGLDNAVKAQHYGANDFDGTVVDERITHMAGCETPVGVTEARLRDLIHQAGRQPARRDALYNVIEGVAPSTTETVAAV
jgi:aminodeoxyfutalosine synthase